MEKTNYQLLLDKTIEDIKNNCPKPKLLLHACCAPCSSYVLEYLSQYFKITILYYNPNISPESEYLFRKNELSRLVLQMPLKSEVDIIDCDYEPKEFLNIANGLEDEKEGGDRCHRCYRLRLKKAAEYAKNGSFDYFTTTLSISPHKNSEVLNKIGKEISEEYGVNYLFSDFKKKNGYKRSCELSEEYSLYRQNYCGCIYSKKEAEERNKTKS